MRSTSASFLIMIQAGVILVPQGPDRAAVLQALADQAEPLTGFAGADPSATMGMWNPDPDPSDDPTTVDA